MVAFPPIVVRLYGEERSHAWWTIDLCFWPDAWGATEHCKKPVAAFVAQCV